MQNLALYSDSGGLILGLPLDYRANRVSFVNSLSAEKTHRCIDKFMPPKEKDLVSLLLLADVEKSIVLSYYSSLNSLN